MFDMGQYLLLKHLGYVMIWRGGIAGLGRESQEGEDRCVFMAEFTLLLSRNQHNIIKQLSSNLKKKTKIWERPGYTSLVIAKGLFLKSESVSCSVVSESLQPQGL